MNAEQTPTQSTRGPSPVTASPKPVVIDSDVSPDDWTALPYLLQHPNVDVKAISVSGTGEAHAGPGVCNVQGLLALTGKPDIPVAGGRPTPLQGNHSFPSLMRWVIDHRMALRLPANPRPPSPKTAVELLASAILDSPQKVTMVTFGPLTTPAELLQTHPEVIDNLEMVYSMGGAIDAPGNIREMRPFSKNTVAEWNIYVDPHAANVVFESGVPFTLVPLDATDRIPTTMAFYERLQADRTTPAAEFSFRTLGRMKLGIRFNRCLLWDPITAAVAVDESLGTFEIRNLRVIEEEGPESGRTLATPDGPSVRVCTRVDAARFEQTLLDTLNRHWL